MVKRLEQENGKIGVIESRIVGTKMGDLEEGSGSSNKRVFP